MNKLFHLGPSILELSKILMYEFWYDYVKPKYDEKAKLCQMDTDFIVYINTDDIIKTFKRMLKLDLIFRILDRQAVTKRKNETKKKVIGLM